MEQDKQLKKIEKLFEMISEEYVKPDEMIQAMELLMKVISDMKDQMTQEMANDKGEMTDKHKEMYQEMNGMEERMKEMCVKIDKKMGVDKKEVMEQMMSEVNRVKEMVELLPQMPDLTYLEKKIDVVEKKIPKIPDEITPDQVANKLNELEEAVDMSVIKDLKKEMADLKQMIKDKPTGRVGGFKKFSIIKRVNLTSQCNGVLKSFALPKDTIDVLGVWGTQFPISFDTADFTLSGNTLTLTSEVSAPETGQTLFALVETLFY